MLRNIDKEYIDKIPQIKGDELGGNETIDHNIKTSLNNEDE